MKTTRLLTFIAMIAMFVFSSCQKDVEGEVTANEISPLTMAKISAMGFNTDNVQRTEGGYIVEGDIFFSDSDLNVSMETLALRVGEEEQYRTNNLVSVGSGRTINVAITTSLPSSYVTALDEAIRRFNAENLRLKFRRVSSGYNILVSKAPSGATYLASAGFPSGGNPYNSIVMNSDYLTAAVVLSITKEPLL
jgi:hypothetical protein